LPAGHGLRQPVQVDVVDQHAPGIGLDQVGQDQQQLLLAAARRAQNGDARRQLHHEAGAVQDDLPVLRGERDVGGAQLPGERDRLGGFRDLQRLVAQPGRIELRHHLLELDLRIPGQLIVAEQLLPRRIQLLVRADHRDQRAEGEIAHDHQVAADRIEEERAELGHEVVDELDEELLLVDLVANVEDDAELLAEARALVLRGVVGPDVAHAGDRLRDAVGEAAHLAHALLAQLVHLSLQLGNDVNLDRIEDDRGQAHDRVLDEHEGQDGQKRAALEQRQGEGAADEAAERLHLGVDHLDDLAGRDAAEMREREAQHAGVELVAQAAQHALADDALVDVEDVFEAAVDQDQDQEQPAQQEQVLDLVELVTQHPVKGVAGQRIVDDQLGQLEGGVKERERGDGHRQ